MEITIKAEPKEIADLVVAVQGQRKLNDSDFEGALEGIISGFQNALTTTDDKVSKPQGYKSY